MNTFRIFLDTANVDEIKDAVSTGIIHGIATNPNKIAKVGKDYKTVVNQISSFFEGPIAVEAVSKVAEDIIKESIKLNELGPNIVVKIPTNKEGIKAIVKLVPMNVKTNATLIFNPGQALAAGLVGSPFISPFIGRLTEYGHEPIKIFKEIREIYSAYNIKSIVIAASIKNIRQAIDVIIAGADAVALTYEVFEQLFKHPLTDIGIEKFTNDYMKIQTSD